MQNVKDCKYEYLCSKLGVCKKNVLYSITRYVEINNGKYLKPIIMPLKWHYTFPYKLLRIPKGNTRIKIHYTYYQYADKIIFIKFTADPLQQLWNCLKIHISNRTCHSTVLNISGVRRHSNMAIFCISRKCFNSKTNMTFTICPRVRSCPFSLSEYTMMQTINITMKMSNWI